MNQLPTLSRFLTKQSFTTLLTSSSRTPVWQTLSTNTNKFSTSTEETNSAKPQADANVEELQNLVTEKTSLLEEKTKEVADLKDKYMRSLAETENVRTRSQKLVSDAKQFGIQSFSKDLLEVADILEKATESVPKDELDNNEHLKNLFEGLTMTNTQLQKVFGNHGLEKVDPVGEKFDPNFHEAIFMMPSPGKDAGTVAVVTKIGYRLNGRSLRAALVGVVQ